MVVTTHPFWPKCKKMFFPPATSLFKLNWTGALYSVRLVISIGYTVHIQPPWMCYLWVNTAKYWVGDPKVEDTPEGKKFYLNAPIDLDIMVNGATYKLELNFIVPWWCQLTYALVGAHHDGHSTYLEVDSEGGATSTPPEAVAKSWTDVLKEIATSPWIWIGVIITLVVILVVLARK